MSLAQAHTFRHESERRLAQAVSEFEAVLSQSQKAEIHSHTRAFDINDIMYLTAKIGRESLAKANERRYCYGLRVISFLEGLQHFAGTIHTIRSAPNNFAHSVWAVVRFSLLSLTKWPPYIEKLSRMLMETSKSMPHFKKLYVLTPRSELLQKKVFEYYTIVVQLCQELFEFSHPSAATKSETAFAEEMYTKQLRKLSKAIHVQIYLEATRLARIESKVKAYFTSYFTSLSARLFPFRCGTRYLRRPYESNREIIDACSQFDYRAVWKQIRKLGTTVVFEEAEAYCQWVQTPVSSCTLVYSGRLGSGKSVLLANVVDDLYLRRGEDSIIAYFFCRYDVKESLMPGVIIECLVRQILQYYHYEGVIQGADITTREALDMNKLLRYIKHIIFKPVFFVLDGIDDMEPIARQELLKTILELQNSISLQLCVTTRSAIKVFHGIEQPKAILCATMPSINHDIEVYIRTEIDEGLATGKLVTLDNDLVQDVKEKLVANSQGSFLWAHLQITILSLMLSDKQVRIAMEDLPNGITETYRHLLQAQDYSRSQYSRRLLELVLAARRPLEYQEIREALSVEPGNIKYNPDNLIDSLDEILRSCSGLVLLDEEEETIQLVHSSARQFLTTSAYAERIQEIDYETRMTEIILTYINHPRFEDSVASRASQAIHNTMLAAAVLVDRPLRYVRFLHNKYLNTVLYNAITEKKHIRFEEYAMTNWHRHLTAVNASTESLRLLEIALKTKRLGISVEQDGVVPYKEL